MKNEFIHYSGARINNDKTKMYRCNDCVVALSGFPSNVVLFLFCSSIWCSARYSTEGNIAIAWVYLWSMGLECSKIDNVLVEW